MKELITYNVYQMFNIQEVVPIENIIKKLSEGRESPYNRVD